MSKEELETLTADPERLSERFRAAMLDRLRAWMRLAEERLGDSGLEVIFVPGNDDEFAIDAVLAQSDLIEAPEGTVIRIADGQHEMLNLAWSNKTPWDTPRECSEEELAEKIRVLAEQIENMDRAIFNIHVPPYGTGLDTAPELENGVRLKRGGAITGPVGSTAVRDAILHYQPLLSLHGHIHEARGTQKLGRTVSINPGSSYSDWSLQGVIVDLDGAKVKRTVPVTG
jgi:Icc-related predicted phosphoesterase